MNTCEEVWPNGAEENPRSEIYSRDSPSCKQNVPSSRTLLAVIIIRRRFPSAIIRITLKNGGVAGN